MSTENEIMVTDGSTVEGGRIVFATDVIATIANLAATEVDGIESMSGTVAEGISGMLNSKKGFTKGVKVDATEETASVSLSIVVKYGYKIHEVCKKVQISVKNAIETMTGLKVNAVDVSVQSIAFDKGDAIMKTVKETKPE